MNGRLWLALLVTSVSVAADYAAPAGIRPAQRRPGAASILPGGRIIASLGRQYVTGPGPFALAVSPHGKRLVTANGGPGRYSLTVVDIKKSGPWEVRQLVASRDLYGEQDDDEWHSVFMGLAFEEDDHVYVSEGNSGRVRLADLSDGNQKKLFELNQGGLTDSYSGDLALDEQRGVLYVLDQAHFRMVAIDVRKNRVLSSTPVGRLPFAIALSHDRRKAYITNLGMFQYQPVPGADKDRARETGLSFPPFGFPSPEASAGAERTTAQGAVRVPGLGDPNVAQSNSLAIVRLEDPSTPKMEAFVRTGKSFGADSHGGSSPSGVCATADRIYVSNAHNDSITVLDARTNEVIGEVAIRIPGLDNLRGVLPIGLAYHEQSGWLLVAEAGINAVGVIDTKEMKVIGHLPVSWFPTSVVVDRDTVYVTNAKGQGVGPNVYQVNPMPGEESFLGTLRRGTISVFPLPAKDELPAQTALVMRANGFRPQPEAPPAIPDAIRYVVLIVKENRTFDEVFGDIEQASNGNVMGVPQLARFGTLGYIGGGGKRLSLQRINVTPNHHAIAMRWAFSDNFYADSEVSVDGHHWLVGSYPNAWTESSLMAAQGGQKDFRLQTAAPGRLLFAESNSSVHPEEQLEAGTIWHHFERHRISFRNFGEGFELAGAYEGPGAKPTGGRFLTNVPMPDPLYRNTSREYPMYNMNIPDQFRATQFIREIDERYVKTGEDLPRFIYIHLPNDHMAKARPEDGYPYEGSFVADNDYALGRILEYLSHSRWWREMAVFVTEDDAQGGIDHIDAHRTILMAAGPHLKRNYVSHVNSSFPGLLKTIFRILRVPPLNLFDAAASDLSDMFTGAPDFKPYDARPVDPRLFIPEAAREPLDPAPSPRMDDPRVLRQQHTRPR